MDRVDSRKRIVIAAHFDDGMLSLGGLLQEELPGETTMVTVCGGRAEPGTPACGWDELAGFTTAEEAMRQRRMEHLEACAALGVKYLDLPYLDGPYMQPGPCYERPWNRQAALADIRSAICGASSVLVPAGVGGHQDHLLVRDLALEVLANQPGPEIRLFADLPYAGCSPQWRAQTAQLSFGTDPALSSIKPLLARWHFTDWRWYELSADEWVAKRAALFCYRSQLAPLGKLFGGLMSTDGPLRRELTWCAQRRSMPDAT